MKTDILKLLAFVIGVLILSVAPTFAQIHSPTSAHTSYTGISMTGYQGWFGAPGDGGTNSFRHYRGSNGFQPGSASIEYWPDMREADEDEIFETAFTFDDGTPATVFSSVNPKTVNRHFRWMKEYGIDGAFVQRFKSDFGIRSTLSKVMLNAVEAAENNQRAVAVMYDIGANIYANGTDSASVAATRTFHVNEVFDDWKEMVDELNLTTRGPDQAYLYHNGKPMVALWGVGFPHRHNSSGLDMEFWYELVDKFQNDPVYGGCSILLGVPTYWRQGGGDAISGSEHTRMIELIKQVDAIMPWHTSRFRRNDMLTTYKSLVAADNAWCNAEGITYAPNVSPGIREKILHGNNYEIPREGGLYFWDMARAALEAGSESLYLGMFDEIDEGTQLFKINNNPPFYSNNLSFTDYGNNPEDHYLWLAGEATRALKGEFTITPSFRMRADDSDFQSGITITDKGSDYEIQLSDPVPGRKVYYADPYKVPDGAPTVGTLLDTCVFKRELTDEIRTFSEEERGLYLRLVEVDETTGAIISFRALVAVHGFAIPPYTTSFERGEIDPQYWTTGSDNDAGVISATTDYEPQTGDYHLLSTTDDTGTPATNYADLHLNLEGIITDIILNYAVKTLGSATAVEDGIYFSSDGGTTFTQVQNFEDATNTYGEFSLNINDLAEEAGLAFTNRFVIRFQHTATGLTEEGGLTLDDISMQFSTIQSGFAQFVGADDTTQGDWMGKYGVDGYYIVGKQPNLPIFADVSWDPNSNVVVWADGSNDVRGLAYTADSTILAARTADAAQHPWWFTVDVGAEESEVYIYFLDGDNTGRQFILNVVDAATGDKYDIQTVQDFGDGKWLGWKLRGEVTFVMELLEGPGAVVSGLFFAPSAPAEIEVADFLTFDGVDDYVDAGRDEALQLSDNTMTLEAWFKVDSTLSAIYQSTILAMDHSEAGNDQGYFLRANGDGQIEWGFGDGQWHEVRSEAGVQLFEQGTWNHVAGVYDGTYQKIYLNGNLIATSDPFETTVGIAPTENLYIGSSPAFNDRVFTGGIAEIRIWNIARTDSEIKEFATQRITGSELGLAAYWPIDEGEGQLIIDRSQNALQGVLGGTLEVEDTDPIWVEGEVGPVLVDILDGFNGSFEDDLDNWRFFEVPNDLGSTVEIITGDVVDGAKAAKVTFVEADATLVDRSLDNWDSNMPLMPDTEYFGEFWAKSDDFNNGVLRVTYGFFDAGRKVLDENTVVFQLTDTYQKYEFSFVPVAGTEKGWISFRWKSEDNEEFRSGVIYLDHIRLLTPDETVTTTNLLVEEDNVATLKPNYPNPFDGFTTIGFSLVRESPVSLQVFDLHGRQVANLLNRRVPPGSYEISWDASDLPNGMYLLILRTPSSVHTTKMLLSKQ